MMCITIGSFCVKQQNFSTQLALVVQNKNLASLFLHNKALFFHKPLVNYPQLFKRYFSDAQTVLYTLSTSLISTTNKLKEYYYGSKWDV